MCFIYITRKPCCRKGTASYWMVLLSMTLSDPWPGFQGHGSFKRRLQSDAFYRHSDVIGHHRHAIDRQLAIQLTTPLLLRKPCKLFASVARVCQRQLGFLVSCTDTLTKKIVGLFYLHHIVTTTLNATAQVLTSRRCRMTDDTLDRLFEICS